MLDWGQTVTGLQCCANLGHREPLKVFKEENVRKDQSVKTSHPRHQMLKFPMDSCMDVSEKSLPCSLPSVLPRKPTNPH